MGFIFVFNILLLSKLDCLHKKLNTHVLLKFKNLRNGEETNVISTLEQQSLQFAHKLRLTHIINQIKQAKTDKIV